MNLSGTGVALVTPFNDKKEIDYKSLEAIIDYSIDGGVTYLVLLGTTAESVTLNDYEKQELLQRVRAYVSGKVPLVVGVGGNNTAEIVKNINTYNLEGYSAILSSSPNYNKPTQEGLYEHYKNIAVNSPLPIVLYNVPSRTSQNLKAKTTIKLATDFKNIIGIKEASNNLAQCIEIMRNAPGSFQLVSGDDLYALPLISCGAKGVISVVAQAAPNSYSSLVNLALSGKFKTAQSLLYSITPLINAIFQENNPAGIKAALHSLGLCKNQLRLPLVPVSKKLEEQIIKNLEKCKN